jgi:superfamily I DNA/RNA helicase
VPHPRAEKDWEKEQERNLEFVALTRAKQDLFFAR